MRILITGGAGFIGTAAIQHVIENTDHAIINIGKLTYAGNLESLAKVEAHPRCLFERVEICDQDAIQRIFKTHQPDEVMHLAAESHVDSSIEGPAEFIQTNIVGACNLLEASRACWSVSADKSGFRFYHLSTDEVLEAP